MGGVEYFQSTHRAGRCGEAGAAPLPADQISDDLRVDTDCSGGQPSMTLRNQSRLLGDFTEGRMRPGRLTGGQEPANRAGKIPLIVLKAVKLLPGIATKEKRSTGWLKGLAGAAIRGKQPGLNAGGKAKEPRQR